MALIGRHKQPCYCCTNESVHVKQNEGKLPYVHCPQCGWTAPTKSGDQAAGLMARTRKEGEPVKVSASETKPVAVVPETPPPPAQAPEPVKRPKPKLGMWEQLAQGSARA